MILLDAKGDQIALESLAHYQNLAIYPGSFNPLHEGHRGIARLLAEQNFQVVFEISRTRYQKPPYPQEVLDRLAHQFIGYHPLLISEAPLFSQKRDQLNHLNPHWVMGYDTAKRWIKENRLVDEKEKQKIAQMRVVFIGRKQKGVYYDPADLITGGETYRYQLFHFQCDISSTELREGST